MRKDLDLRGFTSHLAYLLILNWFNEDELRSLVENSDTADQNLNAAVAAGLIQFWDEEEDVTDIDVNKVIISAFYFVGYNDNLIPDGDRGPELLIAINNYFDEIGEKRIPEESDTDANELVLEEVGETTEE